MYSNFSDKNPENQVEQYIEIKPWDRFFARSFDYIIFTSIVLFLYNVLFQGKLEESMPFFLLMLISFLWVPFESILMCTWGKTPGKWLFCIKVTVQDSKKPDFTQALMRSLSVWFFGMGMGIPVISTICNVINYKILTAARILPFDRKKGFTVEHDYKNVFKKAIIILVYGFLIYNRIIMPLDRETASIINEDISIYSETNAYLNQSGYSLMEKGEYQKAKEVFLKDLKSCKSFEVEDTLLNNLSWACYSLKEYHEALKYSKKALELGRSNASEYLNYANALYSLGNTSEAEKAYQAALNIDNNNSYALYGLGIIKYDNYYYDEAIPFFEKYTAFEGNDLAGWCYLGLSHLYNSNNILKSKEYLDKAYKLSPNDIFVIDSLCTYYSYIGEYKEAENLYIKALEENPDNYDLICDIALFYSNEMKYDKAIEFADRAINCNKMNYNAYSTKADALFALGKDDEAIITIRTMVANNPHNANVIYVAGYIYQNTYKYKNAIDYYTRALVLNPTHENAIIGKLISLFNSKRYTACLNFAREYESKVNNYLIQWYIGDVYSRLMNPEKAIEYYTKASNMKEDDTSLLLSIGWEYYYLEDYDKASEYADKALKINDNHYGADYIKTCINKRKSNISEQVSEFIEDNYMYYKPNDKYQAIKNSLKGKASVSVSDIEDLFNAARKEDDMFSFMLTGDDYKYYQSLQQENTVEYKSLNDTTDYIRISGFSVNTANDVLNIIDSLENSKDRYLVIDLRGNSGGVTASGADILDFLLPDSVVCNLIYRDGYSDAYCSDDELIEFKHIFVLVDEYSASCSELLTLGLKTYLDNVTVIGKKTFGKGVGQTLFEDKTNGFVIFLVNHYWNVRQENINEKGIIPDKTVEGDSLEEFMAVVSEERS